MKQVQSDSTGHACHGEVNLWVVAVSQIWFMVGRIYSTSNPVQEDKFKSVTMVMSLTDTLE